MSNPFNHAALWRDVGRMTFKSGLPAATALTADPDVNALIHEGFAAAARRADRKREPKTGHQQDASQ